MYVYLRSRQGSYFHNNICHVIHRGIYIYDIKSISLLEGEYGKPIYRYDTANLFLCERGHSHWVGRGITFRLIN